MRALCKLKPEPGLSLTDVPIPEIGHQDVLIKVRKAAICGTDVHIYNWDKWAAGDVLVPVVVGHEFVGEIARLGSEVTEFKVGDRVSGEGHIACGSCRQCRSGTPHLCPKTVAIGRHRDGCFAEYLKLPAVNVVKLPDEVPDEVAAFLDPFGNAVHTALSFDLVGENVLITGAGPVGILSAAVAQRAGARFIVITDVNPYRLALAKRMGATHTIDVRHESLRDVMRLLDITGFDVGFEMSGNPQAFNDLLDAMDNGGRVAILGVPPGPLTFDINQVIFKCLTLKGIYGREMFGTWHKMINMIQSGLDLRPVMTHQFPAADYEKAFFAMCDGESGKIILDWS